MDPMTMDPMNCLTDLSNQLRLGRITVQEFRVRLVKSLVGMTGDEFLSVALSLNDVDPDDWDNDIVELKARKE
jgi:hypothetical protein